MYPSVRKLQIACLITSFSVSSGWAWVATAQAVSCSSAENRYAYCPCDTTGGVRLAEQQGGVTCVFNETWGFDDQGIWVDQGCAGRFLLGEGGPVEGPGSRTTDCEVPVLYESAAFSGRNLELVESQGNLEVSGFGDKASSICVPSGWTVTVFDGTEYRGTSAEFRGPAMVADFSMDRPGDRDWDNRASSARVSSPPPASAERVEAQLQDLLALCESALLSRVHLLDKKATVTVDPNPRRTRLSTVDEELVGTARLELKGSRAAIRFECLVNIPDHRVIRIDYRADGPAHP